MKNAGPIGIWEPREEGGERVWVRPPQAPWGDHYAETRVIKAKKAKGKTRLCFFGESVAGGYLYGSDCRPGKVLELQLNALSGSPDFEVIDLAQTNETLSGLKEKIKASIQLDPDWIVVFAGNNWTMLESPEMSPSYPSIKGRKEWAACLRREGLRAAADLALQKVLPGADELLSELCLPDKTGIADRLIWVIPETNLGDWENRQPVPWLPGDGTAKWYDLYQGALQKLEIRDWEGAEEIAWAMEDLDGGTCPSTYRVLARAFAGAGALKKARLAAQAEVDANRYVSMGFLGAPQLNSSGRAFLKAASEVYGFAVLDLAEVFEKYSASPLPGRRLFLDYCHLTSEGIYESMRALAESILSRLNRTPAGKALEAELPPHQEARARFGAAIHVAHRMLDHGRGTGMVAHWCREALRISNDVRETMLHYIKMRLSNSQAAWSAGPSPLYCGEYRLLAEHGLEYDFVDAEILAALAECLPDEWKKIIQEGDFFPQGDLIHTLRCLQRPVERPFAEVMNFRDVSDRAFFRAIWYETGFALTGVPAGAVQLDCTLRLPGIPGSRTLRNGIVEVFLNGKTKGRFPAGQNWVNHQLLLDAQDFQPSVNRLVIRWPPIPPCGDEALENILARLESGWEADLFPVFGEIFRLHVSPAGKTE